jgi:thermitase
VSLGGDPPSKAERDALAAARGTLFVIAAGNEGEDNDVPREAHFPCSYTLPNVICVAASTARDGLADFSNHGRTKVHLAAPGSRILSTQPGDDYGTWSGTSMAAPHVAGTAALIWSAHPQLSVAEVRWALLRGAERRSAFVGRTVTGGRLNARRSLELAARLR